MKWSYTIATVLNSFTIAYVSWQLHRFVAEQKTMSVRLTNMNLHHLIHDHEWQHYKCAHCHIEFEAELIG